MKRTRAVAVLIFALFTSPVRAADGVAAADSNASKHREWHFFANIAYTARTLDGSIDNRNAIAGDAAGSMVATGDSMNLERSDTFMYTLAV